MSACFFLKKNFTISFINIFVSHALKSKANQKSEKLLSIFRLSWYL